MKNLDTNTFEAQISSGVTVVDYWAPWCAQCVPVMSKLEGLEPDYPKVVFAKVNSDENRNIAESNQILILPTVQVWKDGVLEAEFKGSVPFSKLKSTLEDLQ